MSNEPPGRHFGEKGHKDAIGLAEKLFEMSTVVKPIDLFMLNYPQDKPDEDITIYRGYIKDAGEKVGFSAPKTNIIMTLLYQVDAVQAIARSGRNTEGVWILNYVPTMEQLNAFAQSMKNIGRTVAPTKHDAITFELSNLRARVSALEAQVRELRDGYNLRPGQTLP